MARSTTDSESAAAALQAQLRRDGRHRRNAMPEAERRTASETIANRVTRTSLFRRSRFIACYLSTGCEVGTSAIILRAWRMKKRIFAPYTRPGEKLTFREIGPDSEFASGPFGISEPVGGLSLAAQSFDLVIVPVVAFDSDRHRIGMGGGYYDRTFSFLRHRQLFLKPKLLGIAFDCQKVEEIAPNPWDIRLFRVITERS